MPEGGADGGREGWGVGTDEEWEGTGMAACGIEGSDDCPKREERTGPIGEGRKGVIHIRLYLEARGE